MLSVTFWTTLFARGNESVREKVSETQQQQQSDTSDFTARTKCAWRLRLGRLRHTIPKSPESVVLCCETDAVRLGTDSGSGSGTHRVTDRREKQPSQRKQGSTHHWGDAKSVGSDLVCFFLWVKDENKTTTDDQQPRPTTAACVGVFLWLSPFLSQSLPVTRRSSRLRCTCCHLALDTPIGDGN
jgi:hypothetical protein